MTRWDANASPDHPNRLRSTDIGAALGPKGNEPMDDTEKTGFMIDLPPIEVEVNAADIASSLDLAEIHELVIDLDDEVSQWELTLLLYHHFRRRYEEAVRSLPGLAVLSEGELMDRLDGTEIAINPDLIKDGGA